MENNTPRPPNAEEIASLRKEWHEPYAITAPTTPSVAPPEIRSTDWLGCDVIKAELRRQREQKGWSEAHDDEHTLGELSEAAVCYAVVASATARGSCAAEWPATMLDGLNDSIVEWPWDARDWKPSNDPLRNLAKAGALIVAEIERIQRLQKKRGIGDGAKHPNIR